MQLSKFRGTIFAATAAMMMSGLGAKAFAEPTVTLSKWVEDVKVSGDYRLRYEYFNRPIASETDRKRLRFRLRLNTDFKLPNNLLARLTFASGTGEQVSTNQSFTGLGGEKSIWIDKAYLAYQPWEFLKIQGGRMENPIWRQYSSDAVWDNDFTPEGFSQSIDTLVGPFRLFANGLQMVVSEDSGSNADAAHKGQQYDKWMFGEQIGLETRLPLQSRLKIAAAKYYWQHLRNGSSPIATGGVQQKGNRRNASGVQINDFNEIELTGELSTWIGKFPLSMQGTSITNIGAKDIGVSVATSTTKVGKLNQGFQVGAIFGKAKEKGTWEVAYFRKYLQTDATEADVADSDFGDGGTNRKGHIMWIAYAPTDFTTLVAKYLQSEVVTRSLAPSVSAAQGEPIHRYQVDLNVKF